MGNLLRAAFLWFLKHPEVAGVVKEIATEVVEAHAKKAKAAQ
jgi:hypothetical protein